MLRTLMTRQMEPVIGAALAGFAIGLLLTVVVQTETTAEAFPLQAEQHRQTATPSTTRVFGSDAGLVLNFIKPDKTADFEAVILKLKRLFVSSSGVLIVRP